MFLRLKLGEFQTITFYLSKYAVLLMNICVCCVFCFACSQKKEKENEILYENILYSESDISGVLWENIDIECPVEVNELHCLSNLISILSKEQGIRLGNDILEEYHEREELLSFNIVYVIYYTEDDVWLYTLTEDLGELDCNNSDCEDFFDIYIEHLLGKRPMPMTLEDELHPLKVVIDAFNSAKM